MKIMNTTIWMDYMDRLDALEYETMMTEKYGEQKKMVETDEKEDKEKVTTKEEA